MAEASVPKHRRSAQQHLLPLPGDDPPEPRAGCALLGTPLRSSSITVSVTSANPVWAKLGGKLRKGEKNEGLYQREVPAVGTLLRVTCYIQCFVHLRKVISLI